MLEAGALEDGRFCAARLRPQFLITLSEGYPLSPLGLVERTGPDWFQSMDRNADGYVSQREFIGPAPTFRKLDADADDLLSPDEASGH